MTVYHLVATLALLASKEDNSTLTDRFSVEASYNKTGNILVHKT